MMPDFTADGIALVPLQSPDGLARIDTRAPSRVAYGDECKKPHVVRVAPDGRAYVVCEGDHVAPGAVLEVDPVTLATKKRWEVGVYPDGIAFGR
jgi:sugar lactone lactonase YvrE